MSGLGSDTSEVDSDSPALAGLSEDFAAERREKAISRAIGEELRRVREERGWSRVELVTLLPSGIGDRTLLSYEHGTRHLTFLRFLEVCWALGADPTSVARTALQRARIQLQNLTIRVDLRALSRDKSEIYRPIHQWARNTLNEYPDGVIEIESVVVKHLALQIGCNYAGLINYMARFIPDNY